MAGKKRFMVRVIEVTKEHLRIRMPNGTIGQLKNDPITVTDTAGTRTLDPMKVGDEIPAYVGDNGNLFIQFAERRSA